MLFQITHRVGVAQVTCTCLHNVRARASVWSRDVFNLHIGSTDYLVEALGPQYSKLELVPDDYGMHALRADLSGDWKVPGETICRHDFLENFSILLKFRTTPRTSSFTLLNITKDGITEFSIVVDLRRAVVTVEFGGYCEVTQAELSYHNSVNLGDNQWHRLALEFSPAQVSLYLDCERHITAPYPQVQTCRVTCDETTTISVLEELDGPGTVSMRTLTVCYSLK